MSIPVPVSTTRPRIPVPVSTEVRQALMTRNEDEAAFQSQLPQFFDLTLALAYRTPAVLSPLHDVRFSSLNRLGIGVIEMTLMFMMVEMVKAGTAVPSWTALTTRIHTKIVALDPAQVANIEPTIARISALAVDPVRDTGLVTAFAGWIRREMEVMPAAAQAMHDLTSGRSTVEQTSATLDKLKGKEQAIRTASNPLSYADAFQGEAISSGIPWFDGIMGGVGGFLRGSGYTCIAISGGGKSTLAYQLAFSMSRMGRTVLLITAEQTFKERYVVNRMWSVSTGIPMAKFVALTGSGPPPDDLVSPEQKAKVEDLLTRIKFYDFAQLPGTLEEIDNLAANHKPDIIILDWAGVLAHQLLDNGTYEELSVATGAVSDYMRNAATRHGCATFTLHQIAGARGKNPFGSYDHTNAQDCKTFSYNVAGALVMSPPDSNGVFHIKSDKCRYGLSTPAFVRFDPSVPRLIPVEGQVRKGKGGKWQTGEDGTIPESSKPKTKSDGGFRGA